MELSFWTDPDRDYEDPIGRRRRIVLTFVVTVLAGFLLAGLWGPGIVLGNTVRGDAVLGQRVLDHLRTNAGLDTIAVVEIDAAESREVRVGEDSGEHWELGSITKTFTAQMLADAVERGEVALDDPLERFLPELAGTPVGAVTLEDLATHHGGVPRLLPSEAFRAPLAALTLRDPYTATTPDLVEESRSLELTNPGEYAYSDLGASLLGHALARAAGAPDWVTLVQTRLLDPLGMHDTVFAATAAEIPDDRVQGHQSNGRHPQPWAAEGGLPSGVSTWTTVGDMRRYAEALLDGTAPGMSALDPRAPVGPEGQIGLVWHISPGAEGQTVTWHNGATFGGTSILLLDRANHRAVVALSNTATSVDRLGAGLIADDQPPFPTVQVLEIAGLVVMAFGVIWVVRRARRATARTDLISAGIDLLTLALLTAMISPWVVVPGWVHGMVVGVGAGGLLLAVRGAKPLPWHGTPASRDKIQVVVSAALLLVVIGLRVV